MAEFAAAPRFSFYWFLERSKIASLLCHYWPQYEDDSQGLSVTLSVSWGVTLALVQTQIPGGHCVRCTLWQRELEWFLGGEPQGRGMSSQA